MTAKKSSQGFIGGVAVLTASTAVVKLIGLFYKIPLIHIIGIEGMAYFLAAYHIYTLLFTVSTAGLPVAVSILVSKSMATGNKSAVEKIYKTALMLFSAIGAIFGLVLILGADVISDAIEIPESAFAIRAVAPSLVFVSAGSAVKGFFQGSHNMMPTGISQIIEATGKLGLGLLFTVYAQKQGRSLPEVAAAAIFGLTCGVVLSTLYLFACRIKHRQNTLKSRKSGFNTGKILSRILSISAPVTLGAAVISVTSIIDTALISSRLQYAGFAPSVANAMYSSYGNLSIPLFNLIPAFVAPVAISVAPMISEAAERKDAQKEKKLMTSALKLAGLIAIPSAFGVAVFGHEILDLVFASQAEAVDLAAPLLSVLAPAIFFSCLITVTNAILQSYGKAGKPIISTALGATVKLISEFILVGIPKINIFGAPISTLLCDITIVTVNLYFIKKYTCGTEQSWKLFGKILIAAAVSTGCTALISIGFSGSKHAIMLSVIINVILYLFITLFSGTISGDDIEMLPKGKKIYKILKEIKLLK